MLGPIRTQEKGNGEDHAEKGTVPNKDSRKNVEYFQPNPRPALKGKSKPCVPYQNAEDVELLIIIRTMLDQRAIYGYRRIVSARQLPLLISNDEMLLKTRISTFERVASIWL